MPSLTIDRVTPIPPRGIREESRKPSRAPVYRFECKACGREDIGIEGQRYCSETSTCRVAAYRERQKQKGRKRTRYGWK